MEGSIASAFLATSIRPGGLVPLLVAALAIMGSPGPATISLAAVGSVYGVRRSLAYLAGIVAGTTLVLVAVAGGLTAALLAVPALRPVLVAGSAAYILRLAYRIATAPPLGEQRGASGAPSLGGAAVLAVANPKAWIGLGAVFASARLASGATTDAAAKTVVLSMMIVVITGAWLVAGASLAPKLRDERRARVVNVALAVALVAATVPAIVTEA
jgi:threonine/homoserine/homoserine lactone efflux protein